MKENTVKLRAKDDLFSKFDLYPNSGNCEDGHLTPYGAAQHIRNGAFLRKTYVDKWNLLGSDKAVSNSGMIYSVSNFL